MYVALVVGCLSAAEPKVQECTVYSAPMFFQTVEACELNVLTQGQLFLAQQGLQLTDFECTTTDIFGVGDV
jgi:hypothetical protein